METSEAEEFFGEKQLISKWEAYRPWEDKKFLKIKPKEGSGERWGSQGFTNARLQVILPPVIKALG